MLEHLTACAGRLGVELTAADRTALTDYVELLQAGNRLQNLTSVRDRETIERRHLLESIALGAVLARRGLLAAATRLLDLGSGGGLPGIPLRIVWPDLELNLLEATTKKARFLEETVVALRLDRSRVFTGRAEDLGHDPGMRQSYDLVTARAVAALPALVELALPFLRIGGTLAAVKGSLAASELAESTEALRLCGGRYTATEPLPCVEAMQVVLIEKVDATPSRFPRRPGRPVASPLGGDSKHRGSPKPPEGPENNPLLARPLLPPDGPARPEAVEG